MKPEQLSVEDQAMEHVRQYAALRALGLVLRFSDTPPAVVLMPAAADSGPDEVRTIRSLGREMLAYADAAEARLPTGAAPTQRTELLPQTSNYGTGAMAPADAKMATLESQLAAITAALARMNEQQGLAKVPMAPGPEPYTYAGTTPTPGERRPDPVAPR